MLSLVLALALPGTIFSGCSTIASDSIPFSQLISRADRYNGKTVTLEAFYFSGFEIAALSESVGPSTSGGWRIAPTGPLVWVEGGIPKELYDELYTQTITPSGYSEHIGRLKVTGEFETGGRYGHLDGYSYQISITSAEMLDWTPPPAATPATPAEAATTTGPTATPVDKWSEAAVTAGKIAEDFIRNSPTFRFDGIEGSIALASSDPGYTSAYRSWSCSFKFETLHPGHGDRTGQTLAEAITAHYATVLVNLETSTVVRATCDNTWDMLKEKELSVTISGTVISGGDTTAPGGPVDAPRVFVYRVLRDEGVFINVSYTAYPPSPAGDAARAKITLDFYGGEVRVGDRIEACGVLDKQSDMVIVAEQGDFIRTSLNKATALGVVVSIREIVSPDNLEGRPAQYIYELLREDGTFINVSYTGNEGVALSLYNHPIHVGDFMKAVGTYDKNTSIVVVANQADMVKTYDHNPIRTKAVWE